MWRRYSIDVKLRAVLLHDYFLAHDDGIVPYGGEVEVFGLEVLLQALVYGFSDAAWLCLSAILERRRAFTLVHQ